MISLMEMRSLSSARTTKQRKMGGTWGENALCAIVLTINIKIPQKFPWNFHRNIHWKSCGISSGKSTLKIK